MVCQQSWVNYGSGSSPGCWAPIVATFCLGWWNILNPSQPNPTARPPESPCTMLMKWIRRFRNHKNQLNSSLHCECRSSTCARATAARTHSSAPWGPSSISATSSATGGTRSTARRPPASTSSTKTSTSDAKQALLGFVKTRVVLIIRNATSFSIYGQSRQDLH